MKNLKQKLCMTALLLSIGMYVCAQGFTVNDVKYSGNADGTAVLKKYKHAEGKVDIPATVTNPKTGKVYTVTAIESFAFSNNKITELTIPNTIKTIGIYAFDPIKLESLVIPGSVELIDNCAFKASVDKGKLTTLVIDSASTPISLRLNAFGYAPIETLVINRDIKYLSERAIPFDFCHTLKKLTIGQGVKYLPSYFLNGCDALELITVLSDQIDVNNLHTVFSNVRSNPKVVIGNDTVSMGSALGYIIKRRELEQARQKELAEYNKYVDFMVEFIKTADEAPEKLEDMYSRMDVIMIQKYPKIYSTAINFVCDSIFLPKKELNAVEQQLVSGLGNNQFHIIGLDNGYGMNMPISEWARRDLLNQDPNMTHHKENYERILALSEKIIKSNNKTYFDNCYEMMLQLVGLCGMDRWKEAEQYFPKVHRAVTANGKYLVPDELTYVKNCLTQRGYKPIVPNYKSSTREREPSNAEVFQLFFKRGLEIHQERKERKRIEEILRRLEEEKKHRK
ncbi:MAG: leucine-rich repeat domain-containing protein [Prevotella sp.]|nr:leucine-rich repeat domain-containing protein [Prevotella sp.]